MRRGGLALVILLAGVLAGCGGSQVITRLQVAANPPSSFSEEFNAICGPSNHLEASLGGRKWAAVEQQYLKKLRRLTPPPPEQATYARFLATFHTVIKGLNATTPAAINAAVENQSLRRKLHAPDCGLPDVAFGLSGKS